MLDVILQLFTSFIASAAFGLIFHVPKRMLLQCGAVGMVGWIVYRIGVQFIGDAISSTLLAAFLVTIISQQFSKAYRMPIIIFSVPGIIPLVPGSTAYDAMRHVVANEYYTAVQLGVQVVLISGAIALGLIFSEVINQVIRKFRH